MKNRRFISILCLITGVAALIQNPAAAEPIRFNRDIRPLLSDNCFACHGPDKNTRKGDLRLDVAGEALKDRKGHAAVVPGQPDASELIRRLVTTDADDLMPPAKSGKKLSTAQIELLRRWIAEGAKFEGHWAFQVPVRHEPPAATGPELQHPIDRFIRARLRQEGLEPSAEADRRTLLRRLSLDLTGLPPTPAEVERFLKDRDSLAYERQVERLLASPHFGERMAIHWLDLVRYADTIGYHGDLPVEVWPYRDYVIRAFNRNLPFNQFTREQIAGDLIPNATVEQKIASTYNRLNRMSTEGGVQDKEFLAKYASDRVRTTATAWMGATMACAECHDHKFDPFTMRDFYQFSAFFGDLKEKGFYDKGFSENDWGPRLRIPDSNQAAKLAALDQQIAKVQAEMDKVTDEALAAGRNAWESRMAALDKLGLLEWRTQKPLAVKSSNGATLSVGENLAVTAGGANPDQDIYTITFKPGPGIWTALRLETLTDEMFPGNRIARAGVTFAITDFAVSVSAAAGEKGETRMVRLAHVTAGQQGEGHPARAMIDGDPRSSWAITTGHSREHQAAFRFDKPLVTTASSVVEVRIAQESEMRRATIGRFRLALSTLDRPSFEKNSMPEDVLKALRTAASERKEDQKTAIRNFYRRTAPELELQQWRLANLQAERSVVLAGIPSTLVSERAEKPRITRVLARGNWMDENGEIVQPGYPEFMKPAGLRTTDKGLTRLDLADWLASKENPMTARAFVNRLWKLYFGNGFTRTPEELGAQGDWPVHAELFDWLASEFMEPRTRVDSRITKEPPRDWDIKHLVRLIVTSATYKQSSAPDASRDEKDPNNRLLARQGRFRLEAELVRDNALAVSGLLERRIGGASARPFQPEGYYAPLNFPKREYIHDLGPGQYRRGIYTHWQRTFLHPGLMAFDAPSREECTAGRVISNTPQQALVLLNDPVFVEAARNFASRLLSDHRGSTPEARLDQAWRRATGRPARSSEIEVLRDLLLGEKERFGRNPAAASELLEVGDSPLPPRADRVELAAWTSVARTLLNLHETITRP